MKIINNNDYNKLLSLFERCDFTEEKKKYILEHFESNNQSSLFQQLYASLGILSYDENDYLQVFERLVKIHILARDILVIGDGYYPVFSEYIDLYQQKIKSGTITLYEPNILISKLGNISIQKEKFCLNTDISKFDLIVAKEPCTVFNDVVVAAIRQRKDFFVTFCDCIRDLFTIENRQEMMYDPFDLVSFDDYDPIVVNALNFMKNYNIILKRINQELYNNGIIFDKRLVGNNYELQQDVITRTKKAPIVYYTGKNRLI